MEKKEEPGKGGIINNFYGPIGRIVNNYGTINENHYGQESQQRDYYTDEEVARALANIVGKGKPIDTKGKWAGALWLLRWECNYPAKAQDFCERIRQLPLPDDLEYPCEYENIRKASTLSFINDDARQMDKVRYSKHDEQEFFQMRGVALALEKELKKCKETGD